MKDGKVLMKISSAVAVASCAHLRPSSTEDPRVVASYMNEIMGVLMANSGIRVSVVPMAYPLCSKIPLIISFEGIGQRLLWYYASLNPDELSDALFEMVDDLMAIPACIPA